MPCLAAELDRRQAQPQAGKSAQSLLLLSFPSTRTGDQGACCVNSGPAPAFVLHSGFVPVELRKESGMKGVQHYAGHFMYSELKALLISFAMNETI